MIEALIARRYAKALLEIAKESDQANLFLSQLDAFNTICQEQKVLLEVLSNRFMDLSARLVIVDQLGKKLKIEPVVGNFLKLLIKKGRINLLDFIAKATQKQVYELEGKMEAVVTSTKPLNDHDYQEIQKILSKITGKTIMTQKEIKPEILGGLSIRLGGEVYDGTIRAGLNLMSGKMKKGT